MDSNRSDEQLSCRPTVQFQMPHFVLGGTPLLAHGGGAEALPGMYGQGPLAWSDYDKYWYDQSYQSSTSKEYTVAETVAEPPSSSDSTLERVHMTPRPFEFDHPPVATLPCPGMAAIEVSDNSYTMPTTDIAQNQPNAVFLNLPSQALTPYSFPSSNLLDPTASLPPLPANGLPLYSASGFDMLRMLAKVATRPSPRIMLGPVDMTCSFVVVDVRRLDSPIVYASPTFTRLTGYSEAEVLGRNCRFLQHPTGQLQRGEPRQFTAPDAVRHLYKSLAQDKECQASLINYRKDGGAFINLVTVIPISAPEDECEGESGEITHCVGFQVDLAEQPNAILQKLRDGSYIVNYSSAGLGASGFTGLGYSIPSGLPSVGIGRDRRGKGVSVDLIELLHKTRAYPVPKQGEVAEVGIKGARDTDRAELHAMLLENTDDFIHVVSLKGSLLYVAPAITRVLGYSPSDLVGKSIADLCHPADIVPLMRELKDASSCPPPPHATPAPPHHTQTVIPIHAHPSLFMLPSPHPSPLPKPVNLLFRAMHKTLGVYVWLEARGRLHVEQGKGRKAIVLVGRRVNVPKLTWGALESAQSFMRERQNRDEGSSVECWGLVSPAGLVLSASPTGSHMLGFTSFGPHVWGPGDPQSLVGRSLASLIVPEERNRVNEVLASAAYVNRDEVKCVRCRMRRYSPVPKLADTPEVAEADAIVQVELRFYGQTRDDSMDLTKFTPSLPPSVVFQMIFLESSDTSGSKRSFSPSSSSMNLTPNASYTFQSTMQSSPLPPDQNACSMRPHGPTSSPATFNNHLRTHVDTSTRSLRPSNMNILAELDTSVASASASTSSSSETSWQYELTRLRFENERMREEVGKLEHVRRGQALTRGSIPSTMRHSVVAVEGATTCCRQYDIPGGGVIGRSSPIMSSLEHPPPILHLNTRAPQKRRRDGGPKPSPT